MTKTNKVYEKKPRDYYPTPRAAVEPLKEFLAQGFSFCEPCAGDGRLVSHLEEIFDAQCFMSLDIEPQVDWIVTGDATELGPEAVEYCELIVTNPPFTWSVLKPMMERWVSLAPTLLLLPADFMHNKRVSPFLSQASWIKSIGRVKWIEDSVGSGVENYAWYMFNKEHTGPTAFFGRDK